MKKVRITTTFTVSDEFYEKEMLQMKNDIQSGKLQREMVEDSKNNNITKCISTFELLTKD